MRPGWYAVALRNAGATVVGLDGDRQAMLSPASPVPGLLEGDAGHLPFADNTFDGVFCSNL
ncbi:MAG: methyltransferase domain-containing protein [Acidimicrobiales bacterium]